MRGFFFARGGRAPEEEQAGFVDEGEGREVAGGFEDGEVVCVFWVEGYAAECFLGYDEWDCLGAGGTGRGGWGRTLRTSMF